MALLISSIALWIIAFVYFRYIWSSPKNKLVECNVAIAGGLKEAVSRDAAGNAANDSYVDLASRTQVKGLKAIRLASNNKVINMDEHMLFFIEGTSMTPLNLKSHSYVLVKKLEGVDKYNIGSKNVLIFKINTDRCLKDNRQIIEGFKAREFLGYANLADSPEYIISNMIAIAPELKDRVNADKLIKKLAKAKDYFGDLQNITISRTYKNGNDRDYSIHSAEELIGQVAYILPDGIIH